MAEGQKTKCRTCLQQLLYKSRKFSNLQMHLANFLLTQNSTNHSRLTLIVQDCFQALVVDSSYRDMRQSAMIVEYAKDMSNCFLDSYCLDQNKFLFWTPRQDLPCQCLPAFSREGYKLERCSEMQWVDCKWSHGQLQPFNQLKLQIS